MNTLREAAEEYLCLRRGLGYKLRCPGRHLQHFVAFLEQRNAPFITTDLAVEWATLPTDAQPGQWAIRLTAARLFARYRSASDSRTEIPPLGLLTGRYLRKQPYLYSQEEIGRLMRAARHLPSTTGLRPRTYVTLFGLLAVAGLRISEALALDGEDVDLDDGVLTIRRTKFDKTRMVPVHPSTQRALGQYARERDRVHPKPRTKSFLLGETGARLTQDTVRWTFIRLSRQIGLRGPNDRRGPRLHDFRHRWAVDTLLRWYRAGIDVERHLPELSTYLGHSHVSDTYWYLTSVPELMHLAMARVDRRRPSP